MLHNIVLRAATAGLLVLRCVPEQAVVHGEVDFAAYQDVWVAAVEVREEVEGEHHGAIGGVLERNDAVRGGAGLDGGEDVFDGCEGDNVISRFGELLQGCL